MGWRKGLTLLLAMAIVAPPAFAAANPPDPLWVPGLYDDADGDDVVVSVLTLSALADPPPATLRPPAPPVAASILPASEDRLHGTPSLPVSRAPPAA